MKNGVAFVTCKDRPGITEDDSLAADAVSELFDVDVVGVPWDSADVKWDLMQAVVIRSTWDYFRRPRQFMRWLNELGSNQTPLFNAPSLARWNAEKTYLRELANVGVPIVPTLWFEKATDHSLEEALRGAGWHRAVIKPTISCMAFETRLVSLDAFDTAVQMRFEELARTGAVMVQPYMDEIISRGEWSLMFFDGAYSHAILKQPATGDFRVQVQFGGSWHTASPSRELIEKAESALAAAEKVTGRVSPLYARVDGLVSDTTKEFLLMELELVEPALFFTADPQHAPKRFANALSRLIQEHAH